MRNEIRREAIDIECCRSLGEPDFMPLLGLENTDADFMLDNADSKLADATEQVCTDTA